MNIYEKLQHIQSALKAPKSQYNEFGKYNYRNCEDILEAAKPLCAKEKVVLLLTDTIESIDGRHYVKATASLINCEGEHDTVSVNAYAREEESKKGMDGSQVTGASSSYARKYALNGLFNIDDTKDSDTTNRHGKDDNKKDNATGKDNSKSSAKMTVEEALQRKTAKGKYYDDLNDDNLQYIIDNSKNADSVTAARLVLEEHRRINDLQPLDDYEQEGDLPF